MGKKFFLFLGIFFILVWNVRSQDTLTFMHYNLLYYGKNTSFCDQSNNNINEKNENLSTIIQFMQPDIFSVNELDGDGSTPVTDDAGYLLNNALNEGEIDFYRKVPFESAYLANTLYYNYKKVRFYSYDPIYIYTGREKIFNCYTFYHYSQDLATGDTVFFKYFVAHLKAGSGYAMERKDEVEVFMNYIQHEISEPGNYILTADLNVYYSDEPAFQKLINPGDSVYRFNDPVNVTGNWHDNSHFNDYHTQSTHEYGECFSYGGMDDRFDFILTSDYIMQGTHGMSYVPGSYRTVGQDGSSFNSSLNLEGNGNVPDSIAEALYNFSDHLPVRLRIRFDQNPGNELGVDKVFYEPQQPGSEDSVKVYANVLDTEDQLEFIKLKWGVNSGTYTDSSFIELKGNYYTGVIPAYDKGEDVYFKVFGVDENKEEIIASDEYHYEVQLVSNITAAKEKNIDININTLVQQHLKIEVQDFPYGMVLLNIWTLDGRLIMQKDITLHQHIQVNVPFDYPAGNYLYEMNYRGKTLKSGIFYKK